MAWNSLPDFIRGILRAAQTVLGVYLKRTCSRVTIASSALSVLNDYALYKSTHSLTHSRWPCVESSYLSSGLRGRSRPARRCCTRTTLSLQSPSADEPPGRRQRRRPPTLCLATPRTVSCSATGTRPPPPSMRSRVLRRQLPVPLPPPPCFRDGRKALLTAAYRVDATLYRHL